MKDEQLIELVRNYSVLYDLSNPKYMDTNFKNTIWNKIGEEMETDGKSCKTRWANIRDNYKKSLKKTVTVSGQKAKTLKLYKYTEQLSFLKKYFEERDTRSNIDHEDIEQDITCEDGTPLLSHEDEENTQNDTIELDNATTGESKSQPLSSAKQSTPFSCPTQRKKQKQSTANANVPKTAAATVMEYLIQKNETGSSSLPLQDPVDAFLAGIAPVLKKLPPQLWHYAKADIFAAVQKHELNMLMGQHHFSCSTSVYSDQPSPGGSYNQPTIGNVFHESSSNQSQQTSSSNHSLPQYFHTFQTENN